MTKLQKEAFARQIVNRQIAQWRENWDDPFRPFPGVTVTRRKRMTRLIMAQMDAITTAPVENTDGVVVEDAA